MGTDWGNGISLRERQLDGLSTPKWLRLSAQLEMMEKQSCFCVSPRPREDLVEPAGLEAIHVETETLLQRASRTGIQNVLWLSAPQPKSTNGPGATVSLLMPY